MRYIKPLVAAASFTAFTESAKHQLIIGTFSTNFLYTVEYDDTDQTLELVKKTPTNAASSWISFSHDKKNLYGTDWNAETPSFISYHVKDASTIDFEVRLEGSPDCAKSKSIFVQASPSAPYAVYGNYFYGNAKCGSVISIHENGTLNSIVQGYEYADGSAVHGVSFSSDSQYLYSADDGGNSLWVHHISKVSGSLEYVQQLHWPVDGSDPRHVVAHPAGKYIYTVLEGSSQVVMCEILLTKLYVTDQSFPLIRESDQASDFWADEVALSANGKYLWASNRAWDVNRKGYISAIELREDGYMTQQYFITETTNSGGFANAVAPSLFDDNLVAITDNSTGFIEMWRMNGDKTGASVVAHLDINDNGGCCANAVWYS